MWCTKNGNDKTLEGDAASSSQQPWFLGMMGLFQGSAGDSDDRDDESSSTSSSSSSSYVKRKKKKRKKRKKKKKKRRRTEETDERKRKKRRVQADDVDAAERGPQTTVSPVVTAAPPLKPVPPAASVPPPVQQHQHHANGQTTQHALAAEAASRYHAPPPSHLYPPYAYGHPHHHQQQQAHMHAQAQAHQPPMPQWSGGAPWPGHEYYRAQQPPPPPPLPPPLQQQQAQQQYHRPEFAVPPPTTLARPHTLAPPPPLPPPQRPSRATQVPVPPHPEAPPPPRRLSDRGAPRLLSSTRVAVPPPPAPPPPRDSADFAAHGAGYGGERLHKIAREWQASDHVPPLTVIDSFGVKEKAIKASCREEELVLQTAQLVVGALRVGPWPSPFRNLQDYAEEEDDEAVGLESLARHKEHMSIVGASLTQLTREVIYPALVASPTGTTNLERDKTVVGVLLLLREVLMQNAEAIFGTEVFASIHDQVPEEERDEYAVFSTRILVTGIILAAIDRLAVDEAEPILAEFTRMVGVYDAGEQEVTQCMPMIDALVEPRRNGKTPLSPEDQASWQISFNLCRGNHLALQGDQTATEPTETNKLVLPTKFVDTNCVHISVLEEKNRQS